METLLNYVLVDCNNASDKKASFKFPSVSTELLSSSNDKVFDFFTQNLSQADPNSLTRLISFFSDTLTDKPVPFNFTRSGYVSKILNSLILNRSGTIALHLLSRPSDLQVLLQNCHCKSVASTVLTLLTLISLTGQSPLMLVAPNGLGDKQMEVLTSKVNTEAVSNSADKRSQLFQKTLDLCFETADKEHQMDLHSNLAWIVGQTLTKNLSEKSLFLRVFMSNLQRVVDEFVGQFDNSIPNKLGFLFLVAFEVLSKEDPTNNETFLFAELPNCVAKFVKALDVHMLRKHHPIGSTSTQTFSKEGCRLNVKVYKVLEALNVALKLYIQNEKFIQTVFESCELEVYLFRFLTDFPFNNVLHNQIKKMLLIVIEKGSSQLVHRFFVDNQGFHSFVDSINKQSHLIRVGNKAVKAGYVGQVVSIIRALRLNSKSAVAALSQSEVTRRELEGVQSVVFRSGVGVGKQGFGGHRLPL